MTTIDENEKAIRFFELQWVRAKHDLRIIRYKNGEFQADDYLIHGSKILFFVSDIPIGWIETTAIEEVI